MKYFKNINPYEVLPINGIVSHRGNQIASKALINNENVEMRVFSLAKGESIDKEYYEMETLFIMIEGSIKIVYKENDEVIIKTGDSFIVIPPKNILISLAFIVLNSSCFISIHSLADVKSVFSTKYLQKNNMSSKYASRVEEATAPLRYIE